MNNIQIKHLIKLNRGLACAGFALLMAGAAPAAMAQHAHTHSEPNTAAHALPTTAQTEAEVRRVDMANGKITLKHGEIKNLDMPPMTMVFSLKDPALAQGLQPGDKVRFTADQLRGQYTVLTLEKAQP